MNISFCLALTGPTMAMVDGPCSDCHTMHNSQNGSPMTFDGSPTPNPYLARGTCIGCHGQSGLTMMADGIPQVNHRDPVGDLAGGNFAYVLGTKGSGASDAKGHNVKDFANLEDTLTYPPGGYTNMPAAEDLTCAGIYGCHGTPFDMGASDPMASIVGSHHTSDSTIDGSTVGKSYRFLYGVVGLEVADWRNIDSTHHNEYSGKTSPVPQGCGNCHFGSHLPAGSTITQLCTTCHDDMHKVDNGGDGIWIRHPSDIVIPDTASDEVFPGTDVVTCISCHFAHGSDYPDLLRWGYDAIIAGGGGSGEGCIICHTTKD